MYDIPDVIFEQYNRAQVSTMMGLFAELNHAWVTIDNAIYLWDYTRPNPELVGHEDQPNSITAVKLMVPRPGVFQPKITHVLVVATTMEILLIGVGPSEEPAGNKSLSLYETKMSLPIKGMYVSVIEGSSATGRIFFAGSVDNEVYELTYQQEEKWFASRCGKINQTSPGYTSLVPSGIWTKKRPEHVVDIVVDDTRNLLYTLSSRSSIRTFHMDTPTTLKLVIEKQKQELLRDISHMMSPSPLLGNSMVIVSISPISAKEASKLHLMATTSTGCRLFLSATRGYGYMAGQGDAPQSMQVQHVKFPPRAPQSSKQRSFQQVSEPESADQPIDTQSTSLQFSRRGIRYPPGYFLCFVTKDTHPGQDILFLSAPDTGRIAYHARESAVQGSKYYEQTLWHGLGSRAEDVGLITKPFSAASTPVGFGNELAVQFDEPATEIAILTNTGVHTIRRRRLVDMFASIIRQGGGEDGLEGEINRFVRYYGRGELAAAALAVACGQGAEASSNDTRVAKITDPATIEIARRVFVEFGGRPSLHGNAVPDGTMQAIDQVQPSSRHEGLALYIGRLIRSIWKTPVISVATPPSGGISIVSKVKMAKLRSIQDELAILDKFLEKNSTFIEGLAGPESLGRVASRQDEIALQGEHQALHSLRVLTRSIVEGISFIMTLFDERVDELWKSLDDTTKRRLQSLTYESLFTSADGKELGKVLVKAIVNLKLASGSNVDTVADALRRKCASFCSAADVTIFKAQEQVKKASEIGANTDMGRNLLNSSLGLFQEVADSLSAENLRSIVEQYVPLQFYAGAIQLTLNVASELDRGNRALAWVNDGKPDGDSRSSFYEKRKRCYELVHHILQAVDNIADQQPETIDGRVTNIAKKRHEAYMVVNDSDDEVFHYDLYDWYLSQGWVDRLLAIRSPFVVKYLQRLSSSNADHIDLLWRFYASTERYYEAAAVQVQLAKSEFQLTLKQRIEYLSRAKANASTQTAGIGRQARQVLLHEVAELLEVANIQDEILQRLKGDSRIVQERKPKIVGELDGTVMGLSEVSTIM
jgi:nuclear pore complex protein Nup155